MTLCAGLGVGVGVVLLVGLAQGPVDAHDAGHRIAYEIGGTPGKRASTVLYVIATLRSTASRRAHARSRASASPTSSR